MTCIRNWVACPLVTNTERERAENVGEEQCVIECMVYGLAVFYLKYKS